MSEVVQVKRNNAVVEVTLNRAERRNALDKPTLDALLATLTKVAHDPLAHVIVIHGAGDGFCSGADLDMMAALEQHHDPAGVFFPSVDTFQHIVHTLSTAPKVTIAAVHGFALGAGLDLALACDLRVASVGTTFACSYVRFGLVPDGGATWALPRMVGLGPALEILLSGDTFSVEDAHRVGVVQRVTEPGKHLEVAMEWAGQLAQRSLPAQIAIKRLARVDPRLSLSAALKEEKEAQRRLMEDGEPFRFLGKKTDRPS